MNELDVLKDVSIKMNQAKIDFMLSGSLAMGYYAQPRMTRDVDIVVHSVEDLIISKLEWIKDSDSRLQKDDIKRLLKVEIDWKYLESWVPRLGLLEQYQRIRNA